MMEEYVMQVVSSFKWTFYMHDAGKNLPFRSATSMTYFLIYWKVIWLPTNTVFNFSCAPCTIAEKKQPGMKCIQTGIISIPNSLVEFFPTLTGASFGVCVLSMYGLAHSPTASHQQVRQVSGFPFQQGSGCHLLWVWCLSLTPPPITRESPSPLTSSCAISQPPFLSESFILSIFYTLKTTRWLWFYSLMPTRHLRISKRSDMEEYGDKDPSGGQQTEERVECRRNRAHFISPLTIETLFLLSLLNRNKISPVFSNSHGDYLSKMQVRFLQSPMIGFQP